MHQVNRFTLDVVLGHPDFFAGLVLAQNQLIRYLHLRGATVLDGICLVHDRVNVDLRLLVHLDVGLHVEPESEDSFIDHVNNQLDFTDPLHPFCVVTQNLASQAVQVCMINIEAEELLGVIEVEKNRIILDQHGLLYARCIEQSIRILDLDEVLFHETALDCGAAVLDAALSQVIHE